MISGVIADFSSAKMFRVNKSASGYVSYQIVLVFRPEHFRIREYVSGRVQTGAVSTGSQSDHSLRTSFSHLLL